MSIAARRLVRGKYTIPFGGGGDSVAFDPGSLAVGTASYAVPSDGTARYVSPSGTNAGGGTIGAPWQTFEYAVANCPAGGTIVMRAGTYHEGKVFTGSGSNTASGYVAISLGNANVTIQNYPGEEVWFDGSELLTGWTASGAYWVANRTPLRRDLYNWTSTYPVPVDDNNTTNGWASLDSTQVGWTWVDYSDKTLACAGRPERVWKRVKGSTDENAWIPLTQVEFLNQMATGDWFYGDAYNDKFYIGVNPNTYDIRITAYQTLFNSLATGTKVRGIGFRRYAPSLPQQGFIKFHRANGTMENCVLQDISGIGVAFIGSSQNTGANNGLVSKCTFRNIGNCGLISNNTDYLSFRDCRFEYCNDKGFNPAPQAASVKILESRYCTGERNLYWYTYRGKGVWYDVDNQHVKEINSDFIGCDQRGFVYELGMDVKVLGCRFINLGAEGIVFMDSEDKEIWNCLFYNIGTKRGEVMGADTIGCSAIANFTEQRAPRESSRSLSLQNTRDERITGGYITWDGQNPGGYFTNKVMVRNCVFGGADYETYWRNQLIGSEASSAPFISRDYTLDGMDIDYNLYNGMSSFQTHTRTYPHVLRKSTAGQNWIYYSISGLASGTTANPAGAMEAHGVEVYDVDRVDSSTNQLKTAYQASGDAAAATIPSAVASLMGVTTGTKRMGAFPRV